MTGGDWPDHSPSAPPPHPPQPTTNNDGDLLLRLVQNYRQQPSSDHHHRQPAAPSHHNLSLDPAVAAVGPTIPIPSTHHHQPQSRPFSLSPQNPNFVGFPQNNPWPHSQHRHSPSPSNPNKPSFRTAPHQHFDLKDKTLFGNTSFPSSPLNQDNNNTLREPELGFGFNPRTRNGLDPKRLIDHRVNWGSPEQRRPGPGPPPGFVGQGLNHRRKNVGDLGNVGKEINGKDRNVVGYSRGNGVGLSGQLDHPGLPSGSALPSVSDSDIEEALVNLRGNGDGVSQIKDEVDDLSEQLVDSVLGEDESDDKIAKKKHHRDKDFRSDARGKWILSQRMRNSRRLIERRRDIERFNAPFLAIYEGLIPLEEEKAKQKQLLTLLEKLVCKEWPNARLYVYGSCANSFGVSKSDIDICLAIDVQDINKSEVLLKLADILQSDNLQNVQALTRARVPIVKLMDPETGISCDICINNVLAVVNSKLLRDYAEIDVRLRQLAFLVKHWAKSRGVNETYQGTLSSYAYVLMCIHFLQLRNPPILPCLQGMDATYNVTVDDIKCAFFDKVEMLRDFGTRNDESIAQLLWGFFSYWAYCHDYANTVLSIRSGCILSKHEKDWTRRIGNDRHLICIEDPFEVSHDLGRVVDKHSIRVLREEFERAAEIMQYDPNPCVALFERYIPS